MNGFVKLSNTNDIPLGQMKSFFIKHQRVLICHSEDGFFAVADKCSHDASPISSGHMTNNHVVCPRHGARFDIKTGEVKAPPAVVGIETFDLKIENDEIFIRLE